MSFFYLDSTVDPVEIPLSERAFAYRILHSGTEARRICSGKTTSPFGKTPLENSDGKTTIFEFASHDQENAHFQGCLTWSGKRPTWGLLHVVRKRIVLEDTSHGPGAKRTNSRGVEGRSPPILRGIAGGVKHPPSLGSQFLFPSTISISSPMWPLLQPPYH